MNAQEIISQARSFLGVRWRHQGRDENGIDCVGLVITSLQRCGWEPANSELLELPNYERQARNGTMCDLVRAEANAEIADWHDLQVGDVIVFRFEGAAYPQHMGFISRRQGESFWLLHSDMIERQVVEHRLTPEWKEHFVAGFRLVTS